MSVRENDHPLRHTVERCLVQVTYDHRRGYIAVGEGLAIITALSLASLRRQIDARLGKGVIARLQPTVLVLESDVLVRMPLSQYRRDCATACLRPPTRTKR